MKRSERPIPPWVKHGPKPSTYSNWGCRCDKCRKANTLHVAKWRARKKAEEAEADDRQLV